MDKRSRKVYVLWTIALTLLISTALFCWLVVVPVWQGRRGHPVGFRACYFPELCQLSGDSGARAVLQRHRSSLLQLPVDDPAVLRDVDTVGDLPRQP